MKFLVLDKDDNEVLEEITSPWAQIRSDSDQERCWEIAIRHLPTSPFLANAIISPVGRC